MEGAGYEEPVFMDYVKRPYTTDMFYAKRAYQPRNRLDLYNAMKARVKTWFIFYFSNFLFFAILKCKINFFVLLNLP